MRGDSSHINMKNKAEQAQCVKFQSEASRVNGCNRGEYRMDPRGDLSGTGTHRCARLVTPEPDAPYMAMPLAVTLL